MRKFLVSSIILIGFGAQAFTECISFPKLAAVDEFKPGVHFKLESSSECGWFSADSITCREGYQSYYVIGPVKYKYIKKSVLGEIVIGLESRIVFDTDVYHTGWQQKNLTEGFTPATSDTKAEFKIDAEDALSELRSQISQIIFENAGEVCVDSFYRD